MKPEDVAQQSGHDRLTGGLAHGVSNLAGLIFGRYRTAFLGLSLTRRGQDEWLATARAFSEGDGKYVVCFGNGPDAVAALMALNTAVGKGKWLEDRYAPQGRPVWKVTPIREEQMPLGGITPKGD